ncbi:uncharacterized protein LOC104887074 [Beta vulgaris subsp. vulgaris]|uniref:uncharacterized protein LOC104887074 n=1 Tax=Beta vulgaris subsp. vulgaris TaxID=3555 RepID=UPI00053F7498|nr:uncharacterized protein LOC104887074 [Beta vulgaris subsp. vulgaris]
MGKDINNYPLIDGTINLQENLKTIKELEDETNIKMSEEDLLSVSKLNKNKNIHDTIMAKVLYNQPGAFFIDGPGGTGKTSLYTALLATLRSQHFIALASATSGIAASNMLVARTCHSRFKLPLDIDNTTTCDISKQSNTAKLLKAAKLIIWDEASMAKRQAIEAVDKMLKDIVETDLPFGGKVIVFGGDFRQVLLVVPKKRREEQIDASLVRCKIWPTLQKIKLCENMRAKSDPQFCEFLLRIGNGTEPQTINDIVKLPPSMIVLYIDETTSLNTLIKSVFVDLNMAAINPNAITKLAILTPKKQSVDDINKILIDKFPGNAIIYHSFDKTIDLIAQEHHEDFLNSLTLNGLPPQTLVLKPNCPVILLRNIDPSKGLCNGTRLICRRLDKIVIDAEIVVGYHRGKRVFIPKDSFTTFQK